MPVAFHLNPYSLAERNIVKPLYMRTFLILSTVMLVIWVGVLFSSSPRITGVPKNYVAIFYADGVKQLETAIKNLQTTIREGKTDQLQEAFLTAKDQYKKIEFLVAYYAPEFETSLNGAALDEVKPEAPEVTIPAEGFQVVEEYLFPVIDSTKLPACTEEVNKMLTSVKKLQGLVAATQISDSDILDAIRLEVFRVITLGISGFDSPLSNAGIREAAVSLEGIRHVLMLYKNTAERKNCKADMVAADSLFNKAVTYLRTNNDFNTFDRMTFIRQHINPLTRQLVALQQNMDIAFPQDRRALHANANNLFAENGFDPMYYMPEDIPAITPEQVKLGKKLFHDPILSGNGARTCGTCHQPEKAFTDGLAKAVAMDGVSAVKRNTPTLINSVLQPSQFYDQRVRYLQDQIAEVIHNKAEMHGDLGVAATRLNSIDTYKNLFQKAYPDKKIAEDKLIQKALAAYIFSLVKLNSPFDAFMRGDNTTMSKAAVQGFNIFMGKGKCGTCHFMPLFNGVVPPQFAEGEAEVLGVPSLENKTLIDEDNGKYDIHHIRTQQFAFKTPTLRNVALTAPYMHNGVYNTLEEVMNFYNNGGGAGLGFKLNNQTLPADSLRLTTEEQQHVIAFLQTLTDTSTVHR
jgi:cytochrome c peroxidase